jgi:hypothetical protein
VARKEASKKGGRMRAGERERDREISKLGGLKGNSL